MQTIDLSEPQKFFMADIVTKNSKTGISSNKRLLVIKKGHLYYYSHVPKNFKNDTKFLQSHHELPKCSIQILNVNKINGFQNKSTYFSIEFQARHMMEMEDIRKTMMLQEFNFAPKNKKQTITWQFTCDSQYIKQKWVHALQTLHAYYKKEKINIQKFFDNINKKQQQKEVAMSGPAIRSSMKVPWRQDQMKKSGSNQNIRKSQLGNLSIRSPSNTKKSISNSEKDSHKQKQKQSRQFLTPQQDLVQSFMKIEKTKSVHESPTSRLQQEKQKKIQQNKNISIKIPSSLPNQNSIGIQQQQKPQLIKQKQKQKQQTPASKHIQKKLSLIELQKQPNLQQPNQNVSKNQLPASQSQSQPRFGNKNLFRTFDNESKSIQGIKNNKIIDTSVLENVNIKKISSLQQKISNLIKINQYDYSLSQDQNISFYQLVFFSCNKHYSFNQRIEAQRKLNSTIGSFSDKAAKSFIQFINTKCQPVQNVRHPHRNNNSSISRYNEQSISQTSSIIQIGYCKYKIAYVNTQSITINGKKKIFYNEASVKLLKKQLNIYNNIFDSILNFIKHHQQQKSSLSTNYAHITKLHQSRIDSDSSINQQNNKFSSYPPQLVIDARNLRVPLCTYIEYKGVSALAFDQSGKNMERQITDIGQINQWKQLLKFLGYNSSCFQFKSVQTKLGDFVIIYLINIQDVYINNKVSKHHNVSFESPMGINFIKKAKKDGASLSSQSLLKYIKSIDSMKDTSSFSCPKNQILKTLKYCYFCKYLRKFYRAGQAQIDELNFINLVLKGDANINKLFAASGFGLQPKKSEKQIGEEQNVQGIFLQFLFFYLGIRCEVDVDNYKNHACLPAINQYNAFYNRNSQQKIIKSIKTYPRIISYSLQKLQIFETFNKIEDFITNKNKQNAEKVIQLKQSIYYQNPFQLSCYPWAACTQFLPNTAQLNYIQNDYITAIQKSKQLLSTASPTDTQTNNDYDKQNETKWMIPTPTVCIPAYVLMIRCYSKFSQQKLHETIKQLIENVEFNYGYNSTMTVTVLSFIGTTLENIGELPQAQNFIKSALKIAQQIYQKCLKLVLVGMYLDLSRIQLKQNKAAESEASYSKAKNLRIKQGYNQKQMQEQQIKFLIYQLESTARSAKSVDSLQKIQQKLQKSGQILGSLQSVKINSHIFKQYYNLMYQAAIKFNRKDLAQRVLKCLWDIDENSKIFVVQSTYRAMKSQIKNNKVNCQKLESVLLRYQSIMDSWPYSKQKSIVMIAQNLKNYPSLTQMMNEAFLQQDQQLLCCFLKIVPIQILRSP